MINLSTYIAGGALFVLAMDWAGVSIGTQFDRSYLRSLDLTPSTTTMVNRADKGDRLQLADAPMTPHVIATVEVIGVDNAAVVYRDRTGKELYRTDPLANATVVGKNVDLPNVTIRTTNSAPLNQVSIDGKAGHTAGPKIPVMPGPKTKSSSRDPDAPSPESVSKVHPIPEGCDPAFSPLAGGGKHNYAAMCLS